MSRDELLVVVAPPGRADRGAGSADRGDGRAGRGAGRGQRGPGRAAGPAGASAVAELGQLLQAAVADDEPGKPPAPERKRGGAGRSGSGASSPVRRACIWRGPTTRTSDATGSRRALRVRRGPGRGDRSGSGRPLPAARDPAGGGEDHPVRPASGAVRMRADAHRRPARGGPAGPVGYGPNLAAFAVYLMVVHFIPAHRWWRCWRR